MSVGSSFTRLLVPGFLLGTMLMTSAWAQSDLVIEDFQDIPGASSAGELAAREVSGCVFAGEAMWIVDNEDDGHLLRCETPGQFESRTLPGGLDVKDLEGITSDGKHLYLMTGGGLRKSGDLDPRRFKLVRVTLSNGRLSAPVTLDMLAWMERLASELDVDLVKVRSEEGDSFKVIEDFKSEGLALDPQGRLLLGLRAPLRKKKSAVISLEGWKEAFEKADSSLIKPKVVAWLDLDGGGVSSLEWDAVAGRFVMLSIEKGKLRSDLWTWSPTGSNPEHLARIRGHKCEGVARIGRTRNLLLLADDEDPDGTKAGRWTLVDRPGSR